MGRRTDLKPASHGEVGRVVVQPPKARTQELVVKNVYSVKYTPDTEAEEPYLAIAGDFGPWGNAHHAMGALTGEAQVGQDGFHVEDQRPIDVSGADSAMRADFLVGTPENGGQRDGMFLVATDSRCRSSSR